MRTKLALIVIFFSYCGAFANENAASTSDVKKLLKVMRAAELSAQMAAQVAEKIFVTQKNLQGKEKERALSTIKSEIRGEELENMLVPVYSRHFTTAEIKELIKFYESSLGKKVILTQPMIVQESLQAGQQWGQGVMQRLSTKLAKDPARTTTAEGSKK